MRILFLNWRDIKNPAAGGAEIYVHEIAKRLVQKGHQVYLFTATFPGCIEKETIDGVEVFRGGNRYTVYISARYFYKQHSSDFGVVIDSINTVPFLTPRFVRKDTPVVAIIYQLAREFWFYEMPFPISWLGYWLEPHWLRNYINIPTLTISKSTARDLSEIGFKNIEIAPVGLNTRPLPYIAEKEDSPTLIFVGRMGYAKCPDHILGAFSYIKKGVPNAKLWMVGDGAMKERLQKRGMDGVTFFGRVEQTKKYELMSKAHVILVPGLREGWGLVVTEANAMSTPAIGYNIHGLRDSIKNGETGLLCEPTPESMSEKALELLENNYLRKRLSENALNWSRQFDWNESANKFLEVLNANLHI